MTTYKIVRFNQRADLPNQTIRRGLTLEEAQAHCRDPETNSRTATNAVAKVRTAQFGDWFDGYEEE